MKNMNFRIKDEAQSEILQRVLFKLGYSWSSGGQDVRFTNAVYVCARSNKSLTFSDSRVNCFEDMDTEEFIKKHTVTYMVSVEGKRAPKKEHFSKEEADKEAYRLAKLLPYRKVRVLKVENVYRSEIVITKE